MTTPIICAKKRESGTHRGLFVEQQSDTVLFSYQGAWECYSLEGGQLVDCSERGTFPPVIRRYVEAWVKDVKPLYAKKKAGAATPASEKP